MTVKKDIIFLNILIFRRLLVAITCIISFASFKSVEVPTDDLYQQRLILALRSIGHDLLISQHNLTTPVSPVQQLSDSTFRLVFDKEIAIDPDSLVSITMRHLTSDISKLSVISVIENHTNELVYGFEIDHEDQQPIPCIGRILPKSIYTIDVNFYTQPKEQLMTNAQILGLAFISICCFAIFWFLPKRNGKLKEDDDQSHDFIVDSSLNQLIYNNETVHLTEKEKQIFNILLKKQDQLVTRAYLIDEVWLKKGVITSRSLDVYISRLRKKISLIPNAQIINQHGKGYLLKLNSYKP